MKEVTMQLMKLDGDNNNIMAMEITNTGWVGAALIIGLPLSFCNYTNSPQVVYDEWKRTSPPGSIPAYQQLDQSRLIYDSAAPIPTQAVTPVPRAVAPVSVPTRTQTELPTSNLGVQGQPRKIYPENFGADMRFINVPGAGRVEVTMIEDGAYTFKSNAPLSRTIEGDAVLSQNRGMIRDHATGDYIHMSDSFLKTVYGSGN